MIKSTITQETSYNSVTVTTRWTFFGIPFLSYQKVIIV